MLSQISFQKYFELIQNQPKDSSAADIKALAAQNSVIAEQNIAPPPLKPELLTFGAHSPESVSELVSTPVLAGKSISHFVQPVDSQIDEPHKDIPLLRAFSEQLENSKGNNPPELKGPFGVFSFSKSSGPPKPAATIQTSNDSGLGLRSGFSQFGRKSSEKKWPLSDIREAETHLIEQDGTARSLAKSFEG
jgi:hypothetical protein